MLEMIYNKVNVLKKANNQRKMLKIKIFIEKHEEIWLWGSTHMQSRVQYFFTMWNNCECRKVLFHSSKPFGNCCVYRVWGLCIAAKFEGATKNTINVFVQNLFVLYYLDFFAFEYTWNFSKKLRTILTNYFHKCLMRYRTPLVRAPSSISTPFRMVSPLSAKIAY